MGISLEDLKKYKEGSEIVTIHLDASGQASKEITQKAYGVSADYTFTILNLDANYNVTVYSSGGGGGVYKDIKKDQTISGSLKSKIFGPTTFKVSGTASVSNVDVQVRVTWKLKFI